MTIEITIIIIFRGGGVSHGGVGGYVYMYKHTEVNFELGPLVYVQTQMYNNLEKTYNIIQIRAWLGCFYEYNCGAGAIQLHLSVLTLNKVIYINKLN